MTELTQALLPHDEAEPLISRQPLFVFILRNPFDQGSEEALKKPLLISEAIERLYLILKTTKEEVERGTAFQEVQFVLGLIKARVKWFQQPPEDKITEKDFLVQAISSILYVTRSVCRFQISLFLSRDRDEIFVKVECDDNLLLKEAIRTGYKLQLSKTEKGDKNFMRVVPYVSVSPDTDLNKLAHYDSDGNRNTTGSIFSPLDKSRLVKSILMHFLSLNELESTGVVTQHYCVHDDKPLNQLNSTWSTVKRIFSSQPLGRVRRYFGEEISLYFAWIGFYLTCMWFPATFGLTVILIGVFSEKTESLPGEPFTPYEIGLMSFCIFLAIWASFFDQLWVRKEKRLAWKWGVVNFEEEEQQRCEYKAPIIFDEVTGRYRKKGPGVWQSVKQALSYNVAALFVAMVVIAVSGIFLYRATFKAIPHMKFYCALANAVQIKIMNVVYQIIARKMNDWENHETESQYVDSLAVKLFLFRFINSYISLFYVAFAKVTTR